MSRELGYFFYKSPNGNLEYEYYLHNLKLFAIDVNVTSHEF